MKFSCDSCDAQYMISDEKLGARGVKVRCKRCSHIIIVRPGQAEAGDPAAVSGEMTSATDDVFADEAPSMEASGSDVERTQVAAMPSGFDMNPDDDDSGFDATTEGGPPEFEDPDPEASPPASVDFGAENFEDPLADAPDPFAASDDGTADEGVFGASDEGAFGASDDDGAFGASDDDGAFAASGDEGAFAASGDDAGAVDGDSDNDSVFGSEGDDNDSAFAASDDDDGAFGSDDPFAASEDGGGEDEDEDPFAGLDDEEPAAPPEEEVNDEVFGDEGFPEPSDDDELEPPLESTAPMAEPPPPEPAPPPPDALPTPPGDPMAAFQDPMSAAADEEPPAPEAGGGDELDDQLAGAFSNLFDAAPTGDVNEPGAEERGPTQVVDLAAMEALRQQAAPSMEGASLFDDPGLGDFGAPAAEPSLGGDVEWHVAIDDDDVGPISLDEIREHVKASRIDRDGLVWRTGMDEWLPAEEVPEIQALFEQLPMPNIDGPPAFDVGQPIDDLAPSPFGGPDEPDPFGAVPDAADLGGMGGGGGDESWQPHGLTEVYNAANLAEQSAQVSAPASSASIPSFDDPAPSDDLGGGGWSPGAASALASLVEDELDHISDESASGLDVGGLPPAESSLDDFPAQSAFDSPLTSGGDDPFGEAGVPLSDEHSGPAAALSSAAMPAYSAPTVEPPHGASGSLGGVSASLGGASMGGMPYTPAPERDGSKTLLILGGLGIFAVLILVIGGVSIALILTSRDDDDPETRVAQVDPVKPADTAPVTPPVDVVAPATPDPAALPAAVDPAEAAAAAAEAAAAAAAAEQPVTEPVKPKPVSTRRRVKPKPKPKPKPEPPKQGSRKGCDPVLDLNCNASSSTSGSSKKSSLSKSDVLGGIKKNMKTVKKCGGKHGTSGKTIKMEFKISKSGRTRNVRVLSSQYAGTPAGNCVVKTVKRWTFPSYSGSSPPPVRIPLKM